MRRDWRADLNRCVAALRRIDVDLGNIEVLARGRGWVAKERGIREARRLLCRAEGLMEAAAEKHQARTDDQDQAIARERERAVLEARNFTDLNRAARSLKVSAVTLWRWTNRYDIGGLEALKDRHKGRCGRPKKDKAAS